MDCVLVTYEETGGRLDETDGGLREVTFVGKDSESSEKEIETSGLEDEPTKRGEIVSDGEMEDLFGLVATIRT